jgi:tryptophan synthase beta subunit
MRKRSSRSTSSRWGRRYALEDAALARKLGLEQLYYKREDQNASGRSRGGAWATKVSLAKQRGDKAR